uniref:LRRcap domain-containing protein n=1 Tax=Angiostrongylus cantonensis TaxID=6313 RepID=A0A0K0DLX0_ANGCA
MLTDVNLSDNELQTIPNSIGRLKKLTILKLEKNHIYHLTQAIGSCEQLTELFLTHNLLQIGGCTSLTVLSLRENEITEIPMDIGKCEKLTVLDLCNNRLSYLPFTINVLFKLQALWLSENQSQAMLKLQVERDPRTGVKVLSCYLLPQLSAHPQNDRSGQNRAFIGGPKVHFPDQDVTIDEEKLPIGQFERHDTPHPKPQKLKKSSIDGHVIHHDGQNQASFFFTFFFFPYTVARSSKVLIVFFSIFLKFSSLRTSNCNYIVLTFYSAIAKLSIL